LCAKQTTTIRTIILPVLIYGVVFCLFMDGIFFGVVFWIYGVVFCLFMDGIFFGVVFWIYGVVFCLFMDGIFLIILLK